MEKIYDYYNKNISDYSYCSNTLRKKMHVLGSVRLALVGLLFLAIWICKAQGWVVLTFTGILFIIFFALLMVYHNRLSAQKNHFDLLVQLNQNEVNALNYDFSAFDGAPDKQSSSHSFSLDLDLFGERSIFQSINRTTTIGGREMLADWFLNPLTEKTRIQERQKAVHELSSLTNLCQQFHVTGKKQPGNKKDSILLNALTEESCYFLHNPLWKALLVIIPLLWAIILTSCSLGILNWVFAGIYFPICFLIGYIRVKQVNNLHNSVNKMEKIFAIYAELMKCIEEQSFQSTELQKIQKQLTKDNNLTASKAIKQMSRYIGGLDQRGSFAGIMLNIFYLRDIRHAILLERWRETHKANIPHWLEALAYFDTYCSLGTFAFNHPGYIYAEITDSYFKMEGKGLAHPLLHRDIYVKNDIEIVKSPWFLIITGANMAGKSTYLRTVGVNYLLSCIGAPACADSLRLYPAHLVTSLRTSDSLVSNESYFFAELKRLKMIIDRIKSGEELFIILDEILKGTNSVDKQKGSMALMRQLIENKTCGIIATHDLLLGTLESEFPGQIKNYRFEADIKDEELSFSYQLREGIAQNMNACFLMNKMGITI